MKEILPSKVFGKLLSDNDGLFSNFINSNVEIRYGRVWIQGYHGQNKDPRQQRTTGDFSTLQAECLQLKQALEPQSFQNQLLLSPVGYEHQSLDPMKPASSSTRYKLTDQITIPAS